MQKDLRLRKRVAPKAFCYHRDYSLLLQPFLVIIHIHFSLKDGQTHQIDKLPKGAKLQVLEYNYVYTTSVQGYTGLDTEDRNKQIEDAQFEETDTTAVYTFTIPNDGAVIHFTNDYNVTLPVILKKAGFDNRDGLMWDLAGASFRFYTDPDKAEEHLVSLDDQTEFTSD